MPPPTADTAPPPQPAVPPLPSPAVAGAATTGARPRARSVLDDLGEEITGIAAPVSVCMALVVLLVKLLNPEGASDSSTVFIASIAYAEQPGDSAGQKLGGALLNAVIFVCVVAGMTFVLFFLFKYKCYRVIYGYMAFAVFDLYFVLTGAVGLRLLQVLGIHMDAVSVCLILFNFSVVGIVGLFFGPIPLFLKQAYLVWTGIVTAFMFTYIPEWTAWVLLGLMAIYDVIAVLVPGGPLKVLVELAIERDQELPALVYEARPSGGRPYRRGWGRNRGGGNGDGNGGGGGGSDAEGSPSPRAALLASGPRPVGEGRERDAGATPGGGAGGACVAAATAVGVGAGAAAEPAPGPLPGQASGGSGGGAGGGSGSGGEGLGLSSSAQVGVTRGSSRSRLATSTTSAAPAPLQPQHPRASGASGASNGSGGGGGEGQGPAGGAVISVEDEEAADLPDAIKLGLGDFIFYSMLVGRAAMYDMTTVYSSFLAIIAGLGITLLLLALAHKALPALPVSITLGVAFYFLTRLVMEPFVVPLALNGVYY